MSLDLFTSNIDDAVAYAGRVSAPEMPSTFEDNFYDAWNKGYLTNQSISGETRKITARQRMVDDAIAKTGDRSFEQSGEGGGFDTEAFNAKVAQHRAARPDLDLQTISDESIQAAADDIGRRQLASSSSFAHREQTTGGSFGQFFGSATAAISDPVNLIAFPLAAPESLGILGTALAWGAIGAGSQVGIEYLNSTAMERIQPGYSESGQPVTNALEAGLGGAVLGGGLKGLAAAWTRAKTGSWPRTVRDAGNVVESEAQIAGTNPLPGVEGEAAHRTALNKAIEDLANGRPVEIDHIITPDLLERSRGLISRLESDQPLSLPIVNRRAIELAADQERLSARDAELAASMDSLPAGDASAADRLNRLDAVERQIAETTDPVRLRKLNDRRDQILVDTNPEALRTAAAPIEQRRLMQSERAHIADQLQEITDEHARLQASMLSPLKLPALGQRQRIPTGPRGQFEMDLKPPEGAPVRAGALPGVTPRINQFGDVVKDTFNYPIKDGGGKTVGNIEFINGTASDPTAKAITIRAAGIEDATARGQGLGTMAYKEIIDWAHAQDKTVYSSGSTNDLSDAVYERLRKQGYDVRKFKDGADYTFEMPPPSGGMPSLFAKFGETGRASKNSSIEAPPGAHAPLDQVSTRPEPSGSSTTRPTTSLSTSEGPATTFRDLELGAIDGSSNKKILQGSNDYKALLASAERNKPELANALQRVTDGVDGASVYGVRIKDESGLVEKITTKGRAPSTISDYIGARIIADTPEAMNEILARFESTGAVIEAENFVHSPKAGYRAYHLQIGLGDGTSAEIQIVPRPIADKMHETHAIRQPFKRMAEASPEGMARFKDAMERAVKISDDAWAAAKGWPESKIRDLNAGTQVNIDQMIPRLPGTGNAKAPAPRYDRGDLLEAQQVYREALWRTQQPESNASHVRFAEEAKAKLDTIERALAPQSKISPDAATALRDELTPAKIEEMRTEPDLADTVARDLDKLLLERPDLEVPTGVTVDAEGRTVPTSRRVEDVVAEADARSAAAKEIEACVGPYPAEAAQ